MTKLRREIEQLVYIVSDVDKAIFFENTALELRKRGLKLSFILINSKSGELDLFLIENQFETHYLSVNNLLFSLPQIVKCRKILKTINPEIIHCHLYAANWIGLWAGYLTGVKRRIYTRHSGWPAKFSQKEAAIDKIQNFLATDIVAISENVRALLLDQGVSNAKIKLVHHGFDVEKMRKYDLLKTSQIRNKYNPLNKYPVIGIIARWEESKGIQYIIPAFKKLLIKYPDALLAMFNVNEGLVYSNAINELLNTLTADSYKKIGFESDIYNLYSLFDIYVHVPINAKYEAFGQTYIEPLAVGVPSVFTLSGIANEFITDEKNALVVDYKNDEQIFEAILRLLNDRQLCERIIDAGREDVQNFALQRYIEKTLDLYRQNQQ